MRTIKFRVWNTERKTMLSGQDVMNLTFAQLNGTVGAEIMQFTGLLDKGGVEIYEGDIIKVLDTNRYCSDCESIEKGEKAEHSIDGCEHFLCTQKVEFKGGWFCDEEVGDFLPLLSEDYLEIEVSGNIYQNPELLK